MDRKRGKREAKVIWHLTISYLGENAGSTGSGPELIDGNPNQLKYY